MLPLQNSLVSSLPSDILVHVHIAFLIEPGREGGKGGRKREGGSEIRKGRTEEGRGGRERGRMGRKEGKREG